MKCAATLLLAATLSVNAQEIIRADRQPRLIYKIAPEYTLEARQARLEGDVLLSADIGLMGKAENIRVIEPLGHGLDDKAIECLRKWRFRPALRLNGTGYVVRRIVTVEFRLRHSK